MLQLLARRLPRSLGAASAAAGRVGRAQRVPPFPIRPNSGGTRDQASPGARGPPYSALRSKNRRIAENGPNPRCRSAAGKPREKRRGGLLAFGRRAADGRETRRRRQHEQPRHPLRSRPLRAGPGGRRRHSLGRPHFLPAGQPRIHLRTRKVREPLRAGRDRAPLGHVPRDRLRGVAAVGLPSSAARRGERLGFLGHPLVDRRGFLAVACTPPLLAEVSQPGPRSRRLALLHGHLVVAGRAAGPGRGLGGRALEGARDGKGRRRGRASVLPR